jgi:hypothetical protein
MERLDAQEARARQGANAAPANVRKRIAAERAEVEALYEERKAFVDRIKSVDEPYLRLATVLVRSGLR